MITVFVLYVAIASRGLASYQWQFLTEVGEYQTMDDCQDAIKESRYRFGDNPAWRPFNDGALCIPRQKGAR